ncbi:MAG: class I SAM-dependent methyltransferase [Spirochaetes bacterium]|nr:class I SAM-dependent methyltransferase [Spirochaetota bacterium]
MKIYIKEIKSLAFFEQKANSDFWDKHWEIRNLEEIIRNCKTDSNFIPMIEKYLPKGSCVLEGGCGIGHLVHALQYNGYKAIGIDFADKTIKAIQEVVPELDVRVGDVRKLPIKDEELDGYISVGVIEHFWEGYDEIISEMARTIKKNGYLFISFPYMSVLRKIKSFFRLYPILKLKEVESKKKEFYQFALNHNDVIKKLKEAGFSLVQKIPFDGIKGFKDEVKIIKPFLQRIYDNKIHQKLRPYLDSFFRIFASHCIILVCKKLK